MEPSNIQRVRFWKDPFVQFLALGALVFIVYAFSRSEDETQSSNRIVIDASTQVWLYDNFIKQFGRPPSRPEMGAIIKSHVDQEIKAREALAMGLDAGDSIVQRRMVQKFEFIFGSEAADRTPDDDVLRGFYRDNLGDYMPPAVISFEHRWFNTDGRGTSAKHDAERALSVLQSGRDVPGDPFPGPHQSFFVSTPDYEVRRALGSEFTRAVFDAPLETWSGPLKSGLGYHLVYVTHRIQPEPPPFDQVRDAVLEQWREAESARLLSETIEQMKAGYEIEIDEAGLTQLNYAPDDLPIAQ